MGIRGKFTVVIVAMAVIVGIAGYVLLERSHDELISQEAVRIAEIVSTQVVNDRAEYTSNVVGKLVADGAGAARDSSQKQGFVKLPAQFVRSVSQRVQEMAGGLYSYSLLSQWNLNPEQGLADDFDRWAWVQLQDQEEELIRSGRAPGPRGYEWQPVYRVAEGAGGTVLQYMKADPAAAQACVTCHNNYEQRPEIRAMRVAQGVPPGKSWQMHELMGGIRVEIPMEEVAATAAAGRNEALMALGGVLFVGFGILYFLISKTIIKPVEASVVDVQGFAEKIDAVVNVSKQSVEAAEGQSSAFSEAQSAAEGLVSSGVKSDDVDEISASIQRLSDAANENTLRAEESTVFCNDLEDSFGELKGRLQKMLGR
jgi:hypothetical protein